MSGPFNVLVISEEPDERESTGELEVLLSELRGRSDVVVDRWFLRNRERGPDGISDPDPIIGSVEVDGLRTWWPSRVAGLVHESTASHLKGLRLRYWFRQVAPDAVILDDGLGARVLEAASGDPVVAIRVNSELPFGARYEPAPLDRAPLVISGKDEPVPAGSSHLTMPDPLMDTSRAARARLAAKRRATRDRLGLPADEPLIVGWGSDAWVDGVDLFVRILWHLEHREGVKAHAVWFGLADEGDEALVLADAIRCGAPGRLHLRPEGDERDRACGDAIFLPHRDGAHSQLLRTAAQQMRRVVAFEPLPLEGGWASGVPALDLDAAAHELARAFLPDSDDWIAHHDLAAWADRLLDALRGLRRG